MTTQNKRGGYPYEDADFYPKYQEVCQICGISSFAHRHKAGSLPKDFERLPEASKTKERASGEDIPRWSERLQKAYDQGYADARREGHPTITCDYDIEFMKHDREFEIESLKKTCKHCGVIRGVKLHEDTDSHDRYQVGYNKAIDDVLATLREEKHIKLAKYLKGTAKALSRLGDEIIARDNFDKEDEELLSKIGSNLLFEAKAYTFRSN